MHGTGAKYAVAAALLAIVPAAGSAQDRQGGGTRGLLSPIGEYVLVGGSVTDLGKKAERDRFDMGGGWDARLGIGSRSFIGLEAAYVGSFRGASGSGPDLLSNGAEGVLRLQVPYVRGQWLVEPFAFGGIGWSRVSLRDAPADLEGSDDVGTVPFGGGLMLGINHVLVEARFTYRAAFSEDLPVAVGEGAAKLQQWAVGGSVGYEF